MRNPLPIYHKTDHNFFRRKSKPNQSMPDKTFPTLLIVRTNPILFHKGQYNLKNLLIYRNPQRAICISYNIMCPSCIESRNRIPFFICSEWKLGFISIIIRFIHPNNRLHHFRQKLFRKTADPFQIPLYLPIFKLQLLLIRHLLNLTSPAFTRKLALCFYTVR